MSRAPPRQNQRYRVGHQCETTPSVGERIRAHRVQVMFIAITVLLFVTWLTPSNSHRSTIWGATPESNCVSIGKGGTYCPGNSAVDDRSNRPLGSDEVCVSLGRRGLLCKSILGTSAVQVS